MIGQFRSSEEADKRPRKKAVEAVAQDHAEQVAETASKDNKKSIAKAAKKDAYENVEAQKGPALAAEELQLGALMFIPPVWIGMRMDLPTGSDGGRHSICRDIAVSLDETRNDSIKAKHSMTSSVNHWLQHIQSLLRIAHDGFSRTKATTK